MQNIVELKANWKKAESDEFVGWDFTKLNGRWISESIPWDYKEIVKSNLKSNYKILDIDTGGGELLLSFNHPHYQTYVTEGYKPNVDLCRSKLSPLGITVVETSGELKLPFESDFFDLIICNHGEFNFSEVYRVLKTGGSVITQQVGGLNNNILSNKLIKDFKPLYEDHNLKNNVKKFEDVGFKVVESNEVFNESRFLDIEALIYYAKIIQWEFPNFSVENCFQELLSLYKEIQNKGFIYSEEHRFYIKAMKV